MYLSDVELGSHGLAAKRVQRKLILLNYLNDMADGVFGVNSETALKAFQDVNGLEPSGVADRLTQNALFSENPVVSKKPVYNQMVIGSSGEAVSAVQQQLIILGFMNGGITGTYNTSTSNGVKALEKYLYLLDNQSFITQMLTHADEAASSDLAVVDAASAAEIGDIEGDPELNPYEILPESESHSAADAAGFEATGIMTDALTRRLLEDGIQVYSDIVREGDRGDLVLRVQRRLASLEYLTASGIDGIYGGGTKKAISSFQARNHMEPTGIADQATQYILFTPDAVKAIKPYMIKVSIADQRVYVYSPDETDNYTILVKEFKCSTGTNSHPTPKGTFKNTGRGATWHYFKKFDCWAQYAWYVDGDIMIHSVIFSRKDERSVSQGSVNALGSKASHGCIRLSVENAKWIWEHCGSGTTVVVY
ncbi:MAG: murein L,D-transpeptidase [Clostridia bacterium]|nr:murein L,D-transpeptidase [Clostridia bacterium]